MTAQEGFYSFYYDRQNGKVYLHIDKFRQPLLFQSSMPQGVGSNDIGLDRGQLGETRLVEFERFGDRVLFKQLNTVYRVNSQNAAERASIDEAFADSVIAGLNIVAQDESSVLVDYTDFLLSDIHGIAERLEQTKQGSFKLDKTRSGAYIARSKAFPKNTELEALVTFGGSNAGEYLRQVAPSPDSISVHLHHSLIELPDDKYQPRRFHPYSGFWKVGYQDYSTAIDEPMEQKFIPRHRLAKKDPAAKVTEAIEPIVYYLDPGTPEPIKTALLEGASWWNDGFEALGYKDAFQVKMLPTDADPMDVRFNVIQWVHRATRGWSYGSSVIDPRSGEIIKGHVTLGSLRVRQDYLIALGLTSPFKDGNTSTLAQKNMALARIRQLSAHEVGHTLGIAHNFAASADGRGSVMDYPHPKLTVENAQVTLEDAYASGLGKWDMHTIAYGYQDLPNQQMESEFLAELIRKAHKAGLSYQSDPDARPASAANAQGHLWDGGADPIAELTHLYEVRKTALANFGINSLAQGASLSSLQETLVPVYYLHRFQIEAVSKLIGGVNYQYELKGDFDVPQGVSFVPQDVQQKALTTMLETLSSGFWKLPVAVTQLIPPKIYGESHSRESFKGRNGLVFDPVSAAEAGVGHSLSLLLQTQRLNRLASRPINSKEQLSVSSLLQQIVTNTIQKKQGHLGQEIKRRIDYVVLNSIIKAMHNAELAPEVRGELLSQITIVHAWLGKHRRDPHFRAMEQQLSWFLQTGEWRGEFEIKEMPPGSPI
ncbi:zinc-dependent metalloprotease [Aliiglaciecola sp. LCG003]|uniref:zinc-dependent metalloprotease n=1 Tax=Aliiglaciecola sp. LCG003 TaxID=3053655 RepID=UPI002573DB58|nr:zinc-dependent metalloprotease [Aliiglaciecola sp. LCG003]WJG11269.1 zinc-dependent metalloprotease [Aliiglaciecola sp. LCG003]